jgi:hypothetical protein
MGELEKAMPSSKVPLHAVLLVRDNIAVDLERRG